MGILSYRDLRVWQAGMDLVEAVYRLSQPFPQREVYGLASQMRRAAVSIPSNIAEGHTKESTREYLRHVSMAQGSLAELQTQIEIAGRLTYLADEQEKGLMDSSVSLARQLYALRNSLLKRDPNS
jgi:four helix bundle protein